MLRLLALAGAIALVIAVSIAFFWGVLLGEALAFDNGQWGNVPPHVKRWFESLRSNMGLCCSMADGRRATWRPDNSGGYEVLIDDEWYSVPPEAVIRNSGNPTGEAIVWYVPAPKGGEIPRIRCFVAGVEG